MESLLSGASLPLIVLVLVLGGFGLPLPEDPALIAAGALAANRVAPLWLTGACCAAAVVGGDLMLFLGGRRLGPAVKRSRPFRALGPGRIQKLDDLLMRRGALMVFLARYMMGVRVATFVLAGMHQMKVRTFLLVDCLAFAISGTLWFGLGYIFATRLADLADFQTIERGIMIAAAVITVGYFAFKMLRTRRPPPGSS